MLLIDASRRVIGGWVLPTGYLHDSIVAENGSLFVVDSDSGSVHEYVAEVQAPLQPVSGEGWLPLPEDAGHVRLRLRRAISSLAFMASAHEAHANNVLVTPHLVWVLHNNLIFPSVLRLLDRRTGATRRDVQLGGPNCHNPLFYRQSILYLLSSEGGLGLLFHNGTSDTLWAAGKHWFSKGLAVVDDVAYFGLAPKQRRAVERNFADAELVAFDLAQRRLRWRQPMPFKGLINAISAPQLAPSCSWKACETRAGGDPGTVHAPTEKIWVERRAAAQSKRLAKKLPPRPRFVG